MRYELLIQPAVPGSAYDPAPLEALLDARGAVAAADGSRAWVLSQGTVEVRRLRDGTAVVATELRVPLSEKTELVTELVASAAELASAAGLVLVDPALSQPVAAADAKLVADSFLRTARYAGQYAGVSEAVLASYGSAEPTGLKPATKVLLGLAALLFLAYWVIEALLQQVPAR